MSKQIMCSLFCPMINKFGVCESTLRRVEQVRECPHLEMRVQFEHRESNDKSNDFPAL